MLTAVLFFIGFALLVKGAGLLVDGASSLARRFGISALAIGLTIVAFGTSTPELVVNLAASLSNNTDIAIGNVLGSNIANILLILGVSAMIYPLSVGAGTVWKEIPFAMLAVLVVSILANDQLLDGELFSQITRIDGLVLISFFVIFLYYIYGISTANPNDSVGSPTVPHQYSGLRSTAMIVLGLAGLVIGGKWIVEGAVSFATALGVSEALIGLTIVAIGTSLPELATSVVAAYKKDIDIAVGNIVGSNIFNIFWILGISSVITPLPFSEALQADVFVTIGATALLFIALFVGRRHTIERWQGAAFVLAYIVYILFLVMRG